MASTLQDSLTVWLARLRDGRQDALEHIVPLVYDEMRRVARRQLSHERLPHALSATTLVHETYLRLLQQRQLGAMDRAGFLAIAGHTMRRILVDQARWRKRLKRGAGEPLVPLDEELDRVLTDGDAEQLLALDTLLDRLAALNHRAARVVEYRIFAGFTLEETAAALDMSVKTVQRTWSTARAWLRKELAADQVST
jgi:RNA polymerase sigma factor (TIGR02999 family)